MRTGRTGRSTTRASIRRAIAMGLGMLHWGPRIAQQSGASLIHARMRAARADLDQGEFTEGGVACTSNLVPKSATSDGDKAKGPALPVAVFGEIPWQ